MGRTPLLIAFTVAALAANGAQAGPPPPARKGAVSHARAHPHVDPDHPNHARGKASIYAGKFAGRKMADGTRMDPKEHVAASKTLPLGSQARVTNTDTGQSTTVTIRDRGPHVKGRIIDLSPAAAQDIGVTHRRGVGNVIVAPIEAAGPN